MLAYTKNPTDITNMKKEWTEQSSDALLQQLPSNKLKLFELQYIIFVFWQPIVAISSLYLLSIGKICESKPCLELGY
jgi:hypothetical protein